jgi:hypothetical protein
MKFKRTKLYLDKDLYIEPKNAVQNLIKKKQTFFVARLNENIGKPKSLWKTLRSMGLDSKKASASNLCLEDENK